MWHLGLWFRLVKDKRNGVHWSGKAMDVQSVQFVNAMVDLQTSQGKHPHVSGTLSKNAIDISWDSSCDSQSVLTNSSAEMTNTWFLQEDWIKTMLLGVCFCGPANKYARDNEAADWSASQSCVRFASPCVCLSVRWHTNACVSRIWCKISVPTLLCLLTPPKLSINNFEGV